MKGGRLKIVNESRYPDAEVEALVRFGLAEIELTGSGIVAVVTDSRPSSWREHGARDYSGTHWDMRRSHPPASYDQYLGRKARHLIVMRLGPPACFPTDPFKRNGFTHQYDTWQEALVGITAHEGMHAQHAHDGAYRVRSGYRARTAWRSGGRVRIGAERIEPKCEAFEIGMLRRYRDSLAAPATDVREEGVVPTAVEPRREMRHPARPSSTAAAAAPERAAAVLPNEGATGRHELGS